MPKELLATARPWFASAIEKVEFGEEITWELMLGSLQTPEGVLIAYSVYLHLPAHHAIGQVIPRTFLIPIGVTEDIIERVIREQVEILRSDRSKLLARATNGPANNKDIIIPGG